MLIRHVTGFAISLAVLSGAVPARAGHFSDVYAFGDSLSDVGNFYILSTALGTPTPVAPYVNGQFSNGPVWVQDLSVALGNGPLTPSLFGGTNYAYGDGQTGVTLVNPSPTVLDLPAQLGSFQSAHPAAPSGALYTLSIGSNDLFKALAGGLSAAQDQAVAQQAVANIGNFIGSLAATGARNFLVMNVPDLGVTPEVTAFGAMAAAGATALSGYFDALLANELASLAVAYPLRMGIIDSFALVDNAVANPGAYGLTDVTTPCWTGDYFGSGALCSVSAAVQDTHLFWDGVHPTEAGHALVASAGLALVAEPATPWLMAPALLALAALYRRRGQAI